MNLRIRYRPLAAAAAVVALLWGLLGASPAAAQPADATAPGKPSAEQFVSIDFNNVDINLFIKFMSELTGTNFVVDQMFREFAVRDGRLVTGQQQYSGAAAARLVIEALGR